MQQANKAYLNDILEAIHKIKKFMKTKPICVYLRSSAVYKFLYAERNGNVNIRSQYLKYVWGA